MVAVKLPNIFENILSVRVLEWLVILVGCIIKSEIELEARNYTNLLV